jgi:hypothetical protein
MAQAIQKRDKFNYPLIRKEQVLLLCGSGFQPRSFDFAAGSRSHRNFYDNFNFPDKHIQLFFWHRLS